MRNKINSYWAKYDGSVWLIGRALWHRGIASDFIRKVADTFVIRILLLGTTLFTSVIVARILGPEGWGLYALATMVSATGIQFGNLGLHTSNTYYVARNRKLLSALVGNSLLVSFVFGGIGTSLTWGLFYLKPQFAPIQGLLLIISLLWIPIGLANLLLQNLLLGIGKVRTYNRLELSFKIGTLFLLGLFILLDFTDVEVIFSTGLIALTVNLILVFLKLYAHIGIVPLPSFSLLKQNITFAIKSYVSSFLNFMVLKADIMMVHYILGSKQTGHYALAATLAGIVYIFPSVIGTILFPKLSAMYNDGERLKFTQKIEPIFWILMISLGILSGLLAEPVIQIIFGEDFSSSVTSFVLMIPGIVFWGASFPPYLYLTSIGMPKKVVYIWLLLILLNLLLNYAIIPELGGSGAALASSITYLIGYFLFKKCAKMLAL